LGRLRYSLRLTAMSNWTFSRWPRVHAREDHDRGQTECIENLHLCWFLKSLLRSALRRQQEMSPSKLAVISQSAECCSVWLVLYAYCTMNGCCSAKTRRREVAAAVVCALSLFVALVAGSALRPHYTTNALPEPGAWTHVVEHVQHDFKEVQSVSATGSLIALKARGSSRPVPISRKPFRYVWMTRDLPSNWFPLSPHSDWSVLPKSFDSAQFQQRGAPCAAFAEDSDNRHTSSLFCILRC
jgi:hypothetical protein